MKSKIKKLFEQVLKIILVLVMLLTPFICLGPLIYETYNNKQESDSTLTTKPLPNLNSSDDDNEGVKVSTIPIGVPIGGGLYINP